MILTILIQLLNNGILEIFFKKSPANIEKELSKCELLCTLCHRKETCKEYIQETSDLTFKTRHFTEQTIQELVTEGEGK